MEEPLLDIEGAARFLGVSKTSLRRWTNSGLLACVRVGGRKERRFRLEDLTAFLQEQPVQGSRIQDHVSIDGLDLPYGTHLCGLYSTDKGRAKLAGNFLAGGDAPGSVSFLVAEPAVHRDLLAQEPALQREIGAGRLVLLEHAATVRGQLQNLEAHFARAIAGGAKTLRLVGDVWGIAKGVPPEAVVAFEHDYDKTLAHRFPLVSLCLYDARRFSGTATLDALRGHAEGLRYPAERLLA
jgi:excisionase family DNA binding protein